MSDELHDYLLGYRLWFAEDPGSTEDGSPRELKLRSINTYAPDWTQGTVEAKCNGPVERFIKHAIQGPAPLATCSCGLYAYDSLETAIVHLGQFSEGLRQHMVLGAALLWGRVITERVADYVMLQGKGMLYRAQYGKCLVLRSEDPCAPRVAEKFGIPIVAEKYLKWKAAEFGLHLGAEA